MKRIRTAIIITLVGVTIAALDPSAASAATGSVSRGTVGCAKLDYTSGYNMIRVSSYVPLVRAASTSPYVDHQWVAWRSVVVEDDSGEEVTGWTEFSFAYASDNAWTHSFVYKNNSGQWVSLGTGWYDDVAASFFVAKYKVKNEVYFLNGDRWEFYGTFFSGKSSTSGSDYLGDGYCSA